VEVEPTISAGEQPPTYDLRPRGHWNGHHNHSTVKTNLSVMFGSQTLKTAVPESPQQESELFIFKPYILKVLLTVHHKISVS
jgi:hypothetical protein